MHAMHFKGGRVKYRHLHHAFRDRGEGFCLLNDFAIAINELLHTGEIQRLIIDLDVHQGNGTQYIFEGSPSVYLECPWCKNYHLRKTTSDWDMRWTLMKIGRI